MIDLRKRIAVMVLTILAGTCLQASDDGWTIARGMRSHLKVTSPTGESYLVTSIQRSRGKNLQQNKADLNAVLLVQDSAGKRWTVTMNSNGDLSWGKIQAETKIQLVGTKDSYEIS